MLLIVNRDYNIAIMITILIGNRTTLEFCEKFKILIGQSLFDYALPNGQALLEDWSSPGIDYIIHCMLQQEIWGSEKDGL